MKSSFKKAMFKMLESAVVKAALTRLVLSSTSIQGWIISFLIERAFDAVIVPLLNITIRKGELFYDQQKGSIQIKRLENAKDIDDHRDAVSHILQ